MVDGDSTIGLGTGASKDVILADDAGGSPMGGGSTDPKPK
jgi:hypothetical protein